jgi:hypothetical protein
VMSRRVHIADGRLTEVHDGGAAASSRPDKAPAWAAGKGLA